MTPPAIRPWNLRAFTPRERRVIRSIAEAMFDDGTNRDIDERLDWLINDVDLLAGSAGSVVRLGIHMLVLVVQCSPVFFGFGLRTVGALDKSRRVAYLTALEHARSRVVCTALFALKTLLTVSYFENPAALPDTGYDGHCMTGEGSLLDGTRKPTRSHLPIVESVS